MNDNSMTVRIDADTRNFDLAMKSVSDSSRQFANIFTSSIRSSVFAGKNLEETLRNIGRRLADLALKSALKPLEDLFSGAVGAFGNAIGGAFAGGGGSVGAPLSLPSVPFAKGGVVSSPVHFGFSDRLGVMGEAGAEAILPLRRGPDGRLGVAGGGGSQSPVHVTFNVTARDATSFKRSEGQLTAMLARAVARGQRNL